MDETYLRLSVSRAGDALMPNMSTGETRHLSLTGERENAAGDM